MLVKIAQQLAAVGILYACFHYAGDFSFRQSVTLIAVTFLLRYIILENLQASRRTSTFSPYCVSVHPNWYKLLSDFKLIRSEEEWERLRDREPPTFKDDFLNYEVFRSGFTFTVIRPPSDPDCLEVPGLTYWDNRKTFLTDVRLFEPIHGLHPHAELFFRRGGGGYELGLKVDWSWWKNLCESGEIGELAKVKDAIDHHGTTRLFIANLPFSAFDFYYEELDDNQLQKREEAREKELEAKGWKRKIEADSEVRDPWRRFEHKYFTVAHRGV